MVVFLQIDYFERAKRLEEIPLIKKAYEEQRVKDMELWELQEEDRVCEETSTLISSRASCGLFFSKYFNFCSHKVKV